MGAVVVIQHVLAPAPFGGAESVVRALASGHRARGHDVSVVSLQTVEDGEETPHPFERRLEREGVAVFPVRLPARAYVRERESVRALWAKFRPDVVHTHGYRADVLHAPVAKGLGLPVVSTVHGFTGGDAKNRFYQWLDRRTLRHLDGVVAVSRPLRARLVASGVDPELVTTIPNAWTGRPDDILERGVARLTLGVPPRALHAGWVGRLSREKGPDVFLDALAHRTLEGVALSASIVGDGALRSKLQVRATALGLDGRVRWHGVVAAAGRYLRAFDVVVISSRTEGTPLVLLEALAAGVPVVATAVGGIPDAVDASEAVLVSPDDPAALAGALGESLADLDGARRRADIARRRLMSGVRSWLEAYEDLYRRVVDRRAHGVAPWAAAIG